VAEPKLLFLLSSDYGELSNALHFVRGTDLDATLLLPVRLFDANRDMLQARARPYATLAEAVEALDREQPDVVFLFSAYLYAVNGILALDAVEALLTELERRRVRVVTSDPFLGLLRADGASLFSERHPQHQWLEDHFGRLAARVRDLTHLYQVPPDGLAGEHKVSVFNPHILSDAADIQQRRARLAAVLGIDPHRPRWLFLLASEDYGAQVARLGRERFEALLLDRLEDAARAGRQAVLIAPQPCVASLAGSGRALSGLISISFCGHDLFTDVLLEAEYAFYWNLFSNSLLARLANRLPVVFFDLGHLAHAMPALLDLGLKIYFAGATPALQDQQQELMLDAVAALAARQDRALEPAIENLRRSPTPRELLDHLTEAQRRAPSVRAGQD
jgi:hypothetical protein